MNICPDIRPEGTEGFIETMRVDGRKRNSRGGFPDFPAEKRNRRQIGQETRNKMGEMTL